MNTAPDCAKRCYRCPTIVRMTPEEFRADPNEFTCCEPCRVKLEAEAALAGERIPAPLEDPAP